MSDDQLISIEENGSYWLSNSDTSYHIIDPIATNLTPIESNGNYSLAKGGSTHYVLDASGNSIRLSSDYITNLLVAGWVPLQVEGGEHFGGFEVLMTNEAWAGTQYGYFSYRFNTESGLDGLKPESLARYESWFQFDLDGIGGTIISPGQVSMLTDISGNQHHIDDGYGGDSIILKKDNIKIDPTSYDGWSATQVIASLDVGGGYEVLWSHTGGKYDVWKVNSEGNFVSKIKANLWEDEVKFGVDLNGDSDTGLVTVEDNGGVHLKHDDNSYFIVKGSNDPVGLTSGGASKGPNSFPGWSATQVEASASGGYEVFWSHSSGKTTAWKVDALGSYQSHISVTKSVTESGITIIKYDDHSWKFGGNSNDSLSGSSGNDTIDGGDGNDLINGYSGHDTLIGGDGDDIITGDGGTGYAGNDILFGNAGNDDLRGRDGNDQIDGGTGSDIIRTGSGSDKIILRIGDGGNTLADADIITDFTDGIDKLRLDGGLLFSQDMIAQGSGAYTSDTIISKGSEYLAILQGIDVSLLSDADFETADIA